MFAKSISLRLLVGAGVLGSVLCSSGFAQHGAHALTKTQTVSIKVDNGFRPDVIKVHAGQQVKLVFNGVNPGCVDSVVFKDLNITKSVKKGQKTVVLFTPKRAGTINFACGMGMMKGKVVVK